MLYKTEAGEAGSSATVPCKANSIFRTAVNFSFRPHGTQQMAMWAAVVEDLKWFIKTFSLILVPP